MKLREEIAKELYKHCDVSYECARKSAQAAIDVVERRLLNLSRHPNVAKAISETPWQPSVGALHVRYGELAVKAAWQAVKAGNA